jgi:hypothetical protein
MSGQKMSDFGQMVSDYGQRDMTKEVDSDCLLL